MRLGRDHYPTGPVRIPVAPLEADDGPCTALRRVHTVTLQQCAAPTVEHPRARCAVFRPKTPTPPDPRDGSKDGRRWEFSWETPEAPAAGPAARARAHASPSGANGTTRNTRGGSGQAGHGRPRGAPRFGSLLVSFFALGLVAVVAAVVPEVRKEFTKMSKTPETERPHSPLGKGHFKGILQYCSM